MAFGYPGRLVAEALGQDDEIEISAGFGPPEIAMPILLIPCLLLWRRNSTSDAIQCRRMRGHARAALATAAGSEQGDVKQPAEKFHLCPDAPFQDG